MPVVPCSAFLCIKDEGLGRLLAYFINQAPSSPSPIFLRATPIFLRVSSAAASVEYTVLGSTLYLGSDGVCMMETAAATTCHHKDTSHLHVSPDQETMLSHCIFIGHF